MYSCQWDPLMTKKFSTLRWSWKLHFTKVVNRSKGVEEAVAHLHINSSANLSLACPPQQQSSCQGAPASVPDKGPQAVTSRLPHTLEASMQRIHHDKLISYCDLNVILYSQKEPEYQVILLQPL